MQLFDGGEVVEAIMSGIMLGENGNGGARREQLMPAEKSRF